MRLCLAKTHGGKNSYKVFNWIYGHFPKYSIEYYYEPYAGGASVLLNIPKIRYEVLNDIDFDNYAMLIAARTQKIPLLHYEKNTFNMYKYGYKSTTNDIFDSGIKEYVLRNMSRGGMKKHFSWSHRLRGGQPGDVNAFNNKQHNLTKIANRLKYVEILNSDAITFLKRYNDRNAFAYIDPPYLDETRTSKKVYTHEMSRQQHRDLLEFLANDWKGLFLLSCYPSTLYTGFLGKLGYNQDTIGVANSSSQTTKKQRRIEQIWKNY